MKKLRIIQLLSLLLIVTMSSCDNTPSKTPDSKYLNLGELLQDCNGHAIVRAKGINEGNFDHCKHYLIIIDDSSNCFEYVGAKYDAEVGDTLK